MRPDASAVLIQLLRKINQQSRRTVEASAHLTCPLNLSLGKQALNNTTEMTDRG